MSTLQVQTLQGPTSGADSNIIRVADGHNLHAKGHVIQTVFTTSTTKTNSTATGWVANTILDTSFTPKFSDSLIIVEVNLQINFGSAVNTASTGGGVRIKSGSTVIGGTPTDALDIFYNRTAHASNIANLYTRLVKTVEDDSSNTGSRTYSFDTQMYTTAAFCKVGEYTPSTMTITEIAQ